MKIADETESLATRVYANRDLSIVDFPTIIKTAVGITRGESLLDIGCGFGHILGELGSMNDGAPAFGVDVNVESIEQARRTFLEKRLTNIEVDVQDATNLKIVIGGKEITSDFFNVVLSTSAFYNIGRHEDAYEVKPAHREAIQRAIREVARLLKPEGRFVLNSPTVRNTEDLTALSIAAGADRGPAIAQIQIPERVTASALIPCLLEAFPGTQIIHVRNPVEYRDEHADTFLRYFLASDFWTNDAILSKGVSKSTYLANVIKLVAEAIARDGAFVVNKDYVICIACENAMTAGVSVTEVLKRYGKYAQRIGPADVVNIGEGVAI